MGTRLKESTASTERVHVRVCTRVGGCACVHTCVCVHVCSHVYMCTHIFTCMHAHVCAYVSWEMKDDRLQLFLLAHSPEEISNNIAIE